LVLAVAACAPTTPVVTVSPSSPSASPVASATVLPPSATRSSPSSTAGAVEVDQALLDVLPDEVEGQPLRPDGETAAEIAGTEDLAPDIEAIGVGLYIQPGSSGADDLAIVNVVRLRPGVFGDAWFRSWRGTYDDGACEVAGGVAPGSAQTRIGDHETHIGTCQGGVHTYHVHLAGPDRVISITSAGEGRFGERVVAGLTE
jgi:hypothetical protein